MPAHQVIDAELRSTLARIEAKLDMMMGGRFASHAPTTSSDSDLVLLANFTTKQHAIIQMVLRDASNEEIASRLKVAPNTVKTHVAMIARKLHVQRRSSVISTLAPVYERVSPRSYEQASGGLPKDWDKEYDPSSPINLLVENKGD